ncbi:hypothetical protein Pelo_7528 [Pelomyxa schiedti]|nr:hypothetical protein Pelo_7528 [Pelomyxa schiedti]
MLEITRRGKGSVVKILASPKVHIKRLLWTSCISVRDFGSPASRDNHKPMLRYASMSYKVLLGCLAHYNPGHNESSRALKCENEFDSSRKPQEPNKRRKLASGCRILHWEYGSSRNFAPKVWWHISPNDTQRTTTTSRGSVLWQYVNGRNALHLVVAAGNIEAVNLLLKDASTGGILEGTKVKPSDSSLKVITKGHEKKFPKTRTD